MLENGATELPIWWHEAMVRPPPSGPRTVSVHAEDGAIYFCNSEFREFRWDIEQPRLLVYGHTGNRPVGLVQLCNSPSRKNPHCQEVARRMGYPVPSPSR
jgi:hypothetical protein